MRWSSRREGTRKRKCFVCGCFAQMNASMHRHACVCHVNTYVSVVCQGLNTETEKTSRQIESFLSQSLPDLHLFHSCCLYHAATASGGKTGSCLNRKVPCDGGQTVSETDRGRSSQADLIFILTEFEGKLKRNLK